MSDKLSCTVCGANLIHKSVLSGTVLQEITGDKVSLINDSTTRNDTIFCSVNNHHELSDELKTKVEELIEIKGM
ncbi:hypothetical protein [Vibrio owensii]|uniref:hypothetical protein n=1 Tax=Vibrio owensii TaxID=696485 RepID=UPI003CC5D42A